MFIIDLSYKQSLSKVNEYLDAHREFLKEGYAAGNFLASGPKVPRTGSIILAMFDDLATCKATMEKDPFYRMEIANYQFIEFCPSTSIAQFYREFQRLMREPTVS